MQHSLPGYAAGSIEMLDFLIDTLTATGAFAIGSVLPAPLAGNARPALGTPDIIAAGNAIFGGRVYSLTAKDAAIAEATLIIQLIGSDPYEHDAYRLATSDSYLLTARGPDLDIITQKVQQLFDQFALIPGIRIDDLANDYDPDQEQYRYLIQIDHTAPSVTSQPPAYPLALVYPGGIDYLPSEYDTCLTQRAIITWHIALLAGTEADMQSAREAARSIQGAQRDVDHDEIELESEQPMSLPAGIIAWQMTVTERHYQDNR